MVSGWYNVIAFSESSDAGWSITCDVSRNWYGGVPLTPTTPQGVWIPFVYHFTAIMDLSSAQVDFYVYGNGAAVNQVEILFDAVNLSIYA